MKRNKLSPNGKDVLLDLNTLALRIKIRMNELKSDINSEMISQNNTKESMIKYADDVDYVERKKRYIKGSVNHIKSIRVKISHCLLVLKIYEAEYKKKLNNPNYDVNFSKLAKQINKHKV